MDILAKLGPSQDPSRHLIRGMAAFGVAAIGFGLALVAQWLSQEWLGSIAFVITAAGVLAGFIAMALGLLAAPGEIGREFKQFRERQQKTWKRPDWKP
jgi:dipeptide/tripeptide permease